MSTAKKKEKHYDARQEEKRKKESRLNYIFPQLFCSVLLIGTAHTEERGWSENTEKMLELFNIRNKSSRALAHSSFDFDRKFYIHGLRAGPQKIRENLLLCGRWEEKFVVCGAGETCTKLLLLRKKKSRINVFLVERGKEPDRERMGNAERPRQLYSKFIYIHFLFGGLFHFPSNDEWNCFLWCICIFFLSLPLRKIKPSSVLGESEEESIVNTVKEQRDFKSFFPPQQPR